MIFPLEKKKKKKKTRKRPTEHENMKETEDQSTDPVGGDATDEQDDDNQHSFPDIHLSVCSSCKVQDSVYTVSLLIALNQG